MSLKHTILGFLKNGPKTGYDLQKKIESTISHFWPSTQSQIYRTLGDMSNDSLIVSQIEYQDNKPNKKMYSITEKGNDELIRWLSSPLEIPGHRNQFLVQLFFSRNIDRETVIENLINYSAQMEKRLDFLTCDETNSRVVNEGNEIQKALYEIIRDNGIRLLQNEISWANASIQRLERI